MIPKKPSEKPSMSQPGQAAPPLLYFIQRDNGTAVPLIPVDELPFNVRLQGVPRALKPEQAYSMDMQYVGYNAYSGLFFKHEPLPLPKQLSPIQAASFLAPDSHVRQVLANSSLQRQSLASTPDLLWRNIDVAKNSVNNSLFSANAAQAKIDDIVASNPSVPQPTQANKGPVDNKLYCTYWVRHGECDYMQQGCRYKHEMPDMATLKKIGFRTVPLWWREKTTPRVGVSAQVPAFVEDPTNSSDWLRRGSVVSADTVSEAGNEDESDATTIQRRKLYQDPVLASICSKGGLTFGRVPQPSAPLTPRQSPIASDLIDLGPPVWNVVSQSLTPESSTSQMTSEQLKKLSAGTLSSKNRVALIPKDDFPNRYLHNAHKADKGHYELSPRRYTTTRGPDHPTIRHGEDRPSQRAIGLQAWKHAATTRLDRPTTFGRARFPAGSMKTIVQDMKEMTIKSKGKEKIVPGKWPRRRSD